MKDVKIAASVFSLLVVTVVSLVVLSRYPGDFSLEWGLSGGKVSIQGVPRQ